MFSFETRPGDGSTDAVVDRLFDLVPEIDPLPGTVTHVASVTSPAGDLGVFTWEETDPTGAVLTCFGEFQASGGAGWGCGDGTDDLGPPNDDAGPLSVLGESEDDNWRSATLATDAGITEVEGVAGDGTEYSIKPLNGYSYVSWRKSHGGMTLTAIADREPSGPELTLRRSLED